MGRNDVEPTKYGKFTTYVFNIVAMQPGKFSVIDQTSYTFM